MTHPTLDAFTRAYLECILFTGTRYGVCADCQGTGMDPAHDAEIDEIECSSCDGTGSDEAGDVPLDRDFGIEDFDDESIALAVADCTAFQEIMSNELNDPRVIRNARFRTYAVDVRAGTDFWFDRAGHGCGFHDGHWTGSPGEKSYTDDIPDRLGDMADRFGECWTNVYTAPDGSEKISLTAGADPGELLARWRRVVPRASDAMDVAVEVLVHKICALIALAMDARTCPVCGGTDEGNTCCAVAAPKKRKPRRARKALAQGATP